MIYILYQNETMNLSLFYVGAGTFGITNDLLAVQDWLVIMIVDSHRDLAFLLRRSKDTKRVNETTQGQSEIRGVNSIKSALVPHNDGLILTTQRHNRSRIPQPSNTLVQDPCLQSNISRK